MTLTHPKKRLGTRIREAAVRGRRWLFPPAIELEEPWRQLLTVLLPGLDLRRVTFHWGMPHILTWTVHGGITLPALWGPGRIRIYLARHSWRYTPRERMGLILHEALHAQQAQDWMRGWSVGPARPFVVLYLACWAGNRFRYAGHPMERDAYAFAGGRQSRFESALCEEGMGQRIDRYLERGEALSEDEVRELRAWCAPLVRRSSGIAGGRRLTASFPGLTSTAAALRSWLRKTPLAWLLAMPLAVLAVPLVTLWTLAWGAVTAALWLVQLVVEGAGLLAVGLAWLVGWLIEGLAKLTEKLAETLRVR